MVYLDNDGYGNGKNDVKVEIWKSDPFFTIKCGVLSNEKYSGEMSIQIGGGIVEFTLKNVQSYVLILL